MLDWEDLKTFLAIAREGNLSAAGRALKVSQTTMARRLALLEQGAGVKLLIRTPKGFVLAPAGDHVLGHVERMEMEALAVEGAITGEDLRLEGLVRITTVETFGARIVTPALKDFAQSHPRIAVELITDTRSFSLARREADIAIRLAPFSEHDAVVQRIGGMAFGLYAHRDYLSQFGRPTPNKKGAGQRVISLQDDLSSLAEAVWMRENLGEAFCGTIANSRDVQLHACMAGLGLACLPRYLADSTLGLERLVFSTSPPVRDIWLGVHRDLRHTPRVRAVVDVVVAAVRRQSQLLSPDEVSSAPKGLGVPRRTRKRRQAD